MKPHFDVLLEPWIPVVDLEGKHLELGILELLKQAHNLKEITDPSPMVEFGLYRLLSVFLMDMIRPRYIDDLLDRLDEGRFQEAEILTYRDECLRDGASFDLFDEKRPFLQTPYVEEWDGEPKPAATLNKMIPSGNNHVHFDHRETSEIRFSFPEAARQLVPLQLFCTAGAQGYPSGPNGAPPYYAIIRRNNLFETLIYNMLPEEDLPNQLRFLVSAGGETIPVRWRNENIVESKREIPETSFLDGMLFPARRVLLISDADTATVSRVFLSQGLNYKVVTNWTDPSVAYRETDKGRFSLKPNAEIPIWKNVGTLVEQTKKYVSLLFLKNARSMNQERDGNIHDCDVMLYGVQTNQASYIDAVKYDLRIPAGLMESESKVIAVQESIELSNKVSSIIWGCLHEKVNGRDCSAIPGVPLQSIKELLKRLSIGLETEFWRTCEQISEENAKLSDIQRAWGTFVICQAKDELRRMMRSVNLRGKSLAQMAEKEELLWKQIKKIEKELDV